MKEIKVAVVSKHSGESLYASNEKIYPREANGRFQSLRSVSVYTLLGVYYLFPWWQWGDRQAVLFDLPARKFHIFMLTFWPQDFFFLTLLLILSGLSLFFFTAVAGRVWCGFACPQTIWAEAFVRMERWVEGTRAQQMKLSASPWNFTKIRKRLSKQFLWISFAFLTGMTFVGYFVPIRELVAEIINLEIAGWSLFWVFFYGFATYGNAGFMREQVCKYMCPYARFQSAMFDKDTLIVAYDGERGEPRERGKRRKDDPADQRGDCIDCGICVQVCPTGIDIRDGLQYECIACAACIDACDEVMHRVDLPTGLIKYTSENRDANPEISLKQTLFRPRILIYATLLSLVIVGFATALLNRASFQVDILRDRNALFRWSSEHQIENSYHVKLMNKSQIKQQYTVSLRGLDAAVVAWAKADDQGNSPPVAAGEIGDYNVIITLPEDANYSRSQSIELVFEEVHGSKQELEMEKTKFWGPAQPPRSGR